MADIDTKERDKKYNLWARKQPAFISLIIPFILLMMFYNEHEQQLSDAKYIVTLIISVSGLMSSLFFLYMFLLRDIAKVFPEYILKLWHYPTTFLLCQESKIFTDCRKCEIRQKIKEKLEIDLESTGVPSYDNEDYKRRVDEAVALIREKTRENHILFEYNCIYGFYRNLTAGLSLELIFLLILLWGNYWEAHNEIISKISILTLILLLISLCFTRVNGFRYAKRLYNVFLN